MKRYIPWGKSLAINLFDCDIAPISDPESIKRYIREVIELIDMKAHGPTYIDRFGEGELEGYSAMQFIKTSSITVHCDEPDKRCFIDIFSCKPFDSKKAKDFSQKFFGAKRMKSTAFQR